MTHHQHTEWFAPQLNRLVHGAILFAIIFCVDSACLADDPPAETTEPPTETAIPSVAERWDRVMCLVEQKKEGENTRTDGGAAFIVNEADSYFLVTAAHVAKFTSLNSRLMLRTVEGGGIWVTLGGIRLAEGDPWKYHPQADLALMQLQLEPVQPAVRASLQALSHPLESLADTAPQRTSELEITGFPMMLGVGPELSPLVMVSRVASRVSMMDANWGKESIVFAFPVVAGGTSGGPVYARNEDPAAIDIVGMTIGYQADKAGPQLAKIIPSTVIREWISNQLE